MKGAARVLKDHLDILPGLAQLFALQLCQVFPFKDDFAFGGDVQPNQKPHEGGFAAAGFANQAQGFAPVQG